MPDPDRNPFDDCDVIVCYGGAKLNRSPPRLDDPLRRRQKYRVADVREAVKTLIVGRVIGRIGMIEP